MHCLIISKIKMCTTGLQKQNQKRISQVTKATDKKHWLGRKDCLQELNVKFRNPRSELGLKGCVY